MVRYVSGGNSDLSALFSDQGVLQRGRRNTSICNVFAQLSKSPAPVFMDDEQMRNLLSFGFLCSSFLYNSMRTSRSCDRAQNSFRCRFECAFDRGEIFFVATIAQITSVSWKRLVDNSELDVETSCHSSCVRVNVLGCVATCGYALVVDGFCARVYACLCVSVLFCVHVRLCVKNFRCISECFSL